MCNKDFYKDSELHDDSIFGLSLLISRSHQRHFVIEELKKFNYNKDIMEGMLTSFINESKKIYEDRDFKNEFSFYCMECFPTKQSLQNFAKVMDVVEKNKMFPDGCIIKYDGNIHLIWEREGFHAIIVIGNECQYELDGNLIYDESFILYSYWEHRKSSVIEFCKSDINDEIEKFLFLINEKINNLHMEEK